KRLEAAGLRVHVDDRERTAGEKYFHWELRGVPLRLELGPRDMEKHQVTFARRDGAKGNFDDSELEAKTKDLLRQIQHDLYQRQLEFQHAQTHQVKTIEEGRKAGGIVVLPICTRADCGHAVEEALDYKTLGVPMDAPHEAGTERCASCGQPAHEWVRFARTY